MSPPELSEPLREHKYKRGANLTQELTLCVIIAVVAIIIPEFTPLTIRPTPYFKTSTGDVIRDFDLDYEYLGETVPAKMLAILCLLLPLAVFIVLGSTHGPKYDVHAIICTFLISTGTTLFVTGMLKRYFGLLRPCFYDLCGFDNDTLECTIEDDEGRKAFPSGHSSVAFSSMTVLTLYFLGKVGINKGAKFGIKPSITKKILSYASLAPMAVATWIAASRVYDNVHFSADIIAGSLIGFVCAKFAHSLWYPSIYSDEAGEPRQSDKTPPDEDEFEPVATCDHLVVV